MIRQMCLPVMYLQLLLASIASFYHGASADITSALENDASSSGIDPNMLRIRRQGGNFVRFGRAPSSFVRIGKMDPEMGGNGHGENPEFFRSDRMPHMNRFIRIGRHHYSENVGPEVDMDDSSSDKDWLYSKIKRPSSFVRIGKSSYDKRAPGFVRIGKGWENKRPSGFVRIGKDFDSGESDETDDVSELEDGKGMFDAKRAPGFVRIGKSLHDDQDSMDFDNEKRSNFVRIGKSLFNPDIEGEHFDEVSDDDDVEEEKRASGFVRIGKSSDDPLNKRAPGFVRIGKGGNDLMNKRAPGFVRIGKSLDEEMSKRAPGFVRIGKAIDEMSKRAPGFVRIGKALDEDLMQKRPSGFVRIGKALDEAMSKRAPGFVRIGKSHNDVLFHKRAPGFVRIGKSNFYDEDEDFSDPMYSSHRPERSVFADGFDRSAFENELVKKSSGFVRIGKSNAFGGADKRPSGFVRIGKDLLHTANVESPQDKEMEKKSSGFVRIGKQVGSVNNGDSLMSQSTPISGERMGDSGGSHFANKNPIRVSRRGSAFVRIGKIPASAFVPMTKDIGRIFDVTNGRKAGYRRRSRNGQSSFVRIG